MDYFEGLTEELKTIRRELHRIPEIGLKEYKTADYIEGKLKELGVSEMERCLDTGIVAVVRAKAKTSAPMLAFRADMDALPVLESDSDKKDYTSCHNGMMHACGHDGHMAMLLGFAKYLMAHQENLKRDVVLIFQPAEEGPGGAQLMVEAGIFEKHPVEKIIGCHIFPQVQQGKIACRAGVMMARSGEITLRIFGKSCHGAQPELGADALVAAAAVVMGLQTIVSRNITPVDGAVLTIGMVQGGCACNVLAEEVVLDGTMRAFSDGAYDTLTKRVQAITEGIAASYGCRAEVEFRHMYRVVDNDADMVEVLKGICGKSYETTKPYMLAEDFSMYQAQIPGLFFFLGSKNEERGFIHPLHNDMFEFDEAILPAGVKTFAQLLERL